MIDPLAVVKPTKRGRLRSFLGKEFFVLKRRWRWLTSNISYAQAGAKWPDGHLWIQHKSLLLRPLKNVEMYLQYNKVVNLGLAVDRLNQVVIEPGQTFSVWRLVGRPTARKGYKEGLTLNNGQIGKGVGGGLCQLGNLIYWMALHTPLTIQERWRHGFDVFPDVNRTIPFACGATLAYNYIDLQLVNHTEQTFQINLWLDDTFLHGEILSSKMPHLAYQVFETDHLFKHQWWGGYTRHNKIWRSITNLESGSITQELVAENHAIMMYNPLIE